MKRRISRHLPELLVSGVVILIVAVIVTKTYTRGMAQANRTACVSHVQQLAQAIAMYRMDTDQVMPGGPRWHRNVMTYVSEKPDWGLYFCPAREEDPGFAYGLNWSVGGLPEHVIQRPTEMVLLADVRNSTDTLWWVNNISFLKLERNRVPLPCHLGRTNVAFCDGHVKSIDANETTKGNWVVGE